MYSVIANDNQVNYGVNTYMADSLDEIKNSQLDCAPGSKAYILVNNQLKTYILTPSREWQEFIPLEGGGSSGGGISEDEVKAIIAPKKETITSTSALKMQNNVEYTVSTTVSSINIEAFVTDGGPEYWSIIFTTGGESAPLTFGTNLQIQWSVAVPALFEANTTYWLSFIHLVDNTYLGVWSIITK